MRIRAVLVVAVALSLAGCTTAPPTPVETTSVPPSATPEPEPVAESIVIGGLSFSILFDDDSSVEYAYTSDPQPAVDALSDAFAAEPVVSDVPEGNCSPAFTSSVWGGFELRSDTPLPSEQQFMVIATDPVSLPVASSDGSVLGEDNSEVYAAAPENLKDMTEETSTIRFDVQNLAESGELYDENGPVRSADGDFAWGGFANSRSGVVTSIGAPTPFIDC